MTTRIAIMAKAPIPGFAKTRLSLTLGAHGAAQLAARMLRHTVEAALSADVGPVEICASPAPDHDAWSDMVFPREILWSEQCAGDLGARMASVVERAVARMEPVLLVGTDCPDLDAIHFQKASAALCAHDVVIAPVVDGGYALLGLNRFHPSLFENIDWSTERVFTQTLSRLRALDWSVRRLPMMRDIDMPMDLQYLPSAWKS